MSEIINKISEPEWEISSISNDKGMREPKVVFGISINNKHETFEIPKDVLNMIDERFEICFKSNTECQEKQKQVIDYCNQYNYWASKNNNPIVVVNFENKSQRKVEPPNKEELEKAYKELFNKGY